MHFGSPEFVLSIIGIVMFAGVLKSWVRAKHGLPDHPLPPSLPVPPGQRHKGKHWQRPNEEVETLRAENARLVDRLEASEERLAVLERIVTDKSYTLANEIEALRHDKIEDRSKAS